MDPVLEVLNFLTTLSWRYETTGGSSYLVALLEHNDVPTVVYFGYQKLYNQSSKVLYGFSTSGPTSETPEETWWVRYYPVTEWQRTSIISKHTEELCSRNLPAHYAKAFDNAYRCASVCGQLTTAKSMFKIVDNDIRF
jgi:hypothetical protein